MLKIVKFFLKKYIFSPQREWLRFDSLYMIFGIIISVATLTVAISLFEGYEKVLKDTILGANSHIYIFRSTNENISPANLVELKTELESYDEVEVVSPLLTVQAMAANKKSIKGCMLRGIDGQQKKQPTKYWEFISSGSGELVNSSDIVLGYKLADLLQVKPGDELKMISPMNSEVTAFGLKPKQKTFTVVGLYKSGMYEYDSKFAFVNMETAMEYADIDNEYSMVEVKLKNEYIEKADYLAYNWGNQFEYRYQMTSWIRFNGNLFSMLKLQKWVIFIILSFLVLVASFNVVSSTSTAIIEKKREVGILKAYGASNSLLKKIFLGRTMFLSTLAVVFGQTLGILLALGISKQNFFQLKGDVYFLEKLNVVFNPSSAGIIFVVANLIVFLASIIPLKNITKLAVTDIIRNS